MSVLCNKSLAIALAALALAASGCGAKTQKDPQAAFPAPEVGVETVAAQPATLTVTLPGRTAAYQVAEVRPQVSGIIAQRLFKEGAAVKRGDPLYQIDKAPYEAALESAEAALQRAKAVAAAAEARAQRYQRLVKAKAVSEQDFDDAVAAARQARADVKAAEAARDSASINLDRTTIKAPIDGRIGRTLVTVGALVTADQAQELAVINALDPIYVDLTQSSAEILDWKRKLAAGELATDDGNELDVTLHLEDGSDYERKGKLELKETNVDPATGSVTLRAVFPNPDDLLMPGMFVRAEVVEGVRKDAILAPQAAIMRAPDGGGLAYVVGQDGKAEQRRVETGRAVGNRWIILAGLQPGDKLIVDGFQHFRPGQPVKPVETSKVAAGAIEGGGPNSGLR
ncbi:MAG: efflux RND transporter periplasmic adaptor subunit [Alphaproteobacteria bacterium]|nr:efflux RND transporter periplasmic adaptor subunit [Alphaproteobacteria bacterium]